MPIFIVFVVKVIMMCRVEVVHTSNEDRGGGGGGGGWERERERERERESLTDGRMDGRTHAGKNHTNRQAVLHFPPVSSGDDE